MERYPGTAVLKTRAPHTDTKFSNRVPVAKFIISTGIGLEVLCMDSPYQYYLCTFTWVPVLQYVCTCALTAVCSAGSASRSACRFSQIPDFLHCDSDIYSKFETQLVQPTAVLLPMPGHGMQHACSITMAGPCICMLRSRSRVCESNRA
eukprot:SAG11_NODE_1845_length_4177_cov_2.602256_4_plen_149_part_00